MTFSVTKTPIPRCPLVINIVIHYGNLHWPTIKNGLIQNNDDDDDDDDDENGVQMRLVKME